VGVALSGLHAVPTPSCACGVRSGRRQLPTPRDGVEVGCRVICRGGLLRLPDASKGGEYPLRSGMYFVAPGGAHVRGHLRTHMVSRSVDSPCHGTAVAAAAAAAWFTLPRDDGTIRGTIRGRWNHGIDGTMASAHTHRTRRTLGCRAVSGHRNRQIGYHDGCHNGLVLCGHGDHMVI